MVSRYWLISLLIVSHFAKGKGRDSTNYKAIFAMEQRVANPSLQMLNANTDSLRTIAAWKLYKTLDSMLHMPGSLDYPFDSLKLKTVSILSPKDRKFRIFTFNLLLLNGQFQQFGYLEVKDGKESDIYPLLDTVKRPAKDYLTKELETEQWHGALYYDIVPFKVKRKKAWLLIGYDGASIHSNKKILDVLWFDNRIPVFGLPVFKEGSFSRKASHRVVYEFHNESRMLLRYEEKRKIIVLDNLAPAFPEATGDFYYYIPSGDYDYYSLDKKGFWVKDALDNFDLGQGKKPKGPTERPKPEPLENPEKE